MRNYEQELFDTIWALQYHTGSPYHDENYSIYRTDFELNKINKLKEVTFRVFMSCGIQFEITRQFDGEDNSTEYIFNSIWPSVLNCESAQSILAVFIILGVDVQTAGGEANG